jgi:Lrp/AsnC family transcriptional regulator, regulator for asnA, asnC and gidA
LAFDDIDLKILDILQRDSRMPFTEIGKRLGIADSTVHIRVKRMLKDGIIEKFSITIHHEALGKVESILMVDVAPGCFEEIVPVLIKDRCITEILELHGEFVASLKISANSFAELRNEIVKIRHIPNVTRTEMIAILKVWKKS